MSFKIRVHIQYQVTLTFSGAPPSGTGNISARYLGIPASNVTTTAYRTVTNFTATSGQTTFTPPSYTAGFINVYRNGVYLPTPDYTATNGTTVVLNNGCTTGDTVTIESFLVSSVLNAIPATAGAVTGSYIASGAVGSSQLASSLSLVTPSMTTPTVTSGSILNSSGRPMAAQTGGILQVVTANINARYSSSSATFAGIGPTLSITPNSTSSRIFLFCSLSVQMNAYTYFTFMRNGTNVSAGNGIFTDSFTVNRNWTNTSYNFVDSPATTSAISYQIGLATTSSTVYLNDYSATNLNQLIAMEIAG